jgi:hypothetical protein
MAQVDALVETWKRKLGLRGWTITRLPRADRPAPSRTTAYSEVDFAAKRAKIWADTEPQVLHELLEVLLSSLHDTLWRANAPRPLRALYRRREESVALRLERALRKP